MYKHILVPIALDHERNSATAIEIAKTLSPEGGRITALTVVEEVPAYIRQYLPDGQLEKNLEDARIALKADIGGVAGIETDAILGHAGSSIVDYATDRGVDLIIVGSHRPGLTDYFLGSTAARVVRHADCSVHVIR